MGGCECGIKLSENGIIIKHQAITSLPVILKPAKNLIFFLFKSKNQKRDPSDFALRMTRKGKFKKFWNTLSPQDDRESEIV
ncbi:MAG TPA: hypothetical protein DEA57_01775 [Sulfurihydrogenibium sp.]|nr:hypothetical protein [Sulfurihydrogenibium sp.]